MLLRSLTSRRLFIFIMYSPGLWKYDALTAAAFLLNVKLVLRLENVPIAPGKNAAVGFQSHVRVVVIIIS